MGKNNPGKRLRPKIIQGGGGVPLIGGPRPPTENEAKLMHIDKMLSSKTQHILEFTHSLLRGKVSFTGGLPNREQMKAIVECAIELGDVCSETLGAHLNKERDVMAEQLGAELPQ